MEDQPGSSVSIQNTNLSTTTTGNNVSRMTPIPKRLSMKTVNCVPLQNHVVIGRKIAGDATLFLLKVAALEAVRRFSLAKCPSVWNGLQGLQMIGFPPFKWLQRWAPFKTLGNTMQMLSRPLLVLSIVTSLPHHLAENSTSDDPNDSLRRPGAESESTSLESAENAITGDEAPLHPPESWLLNLYQELNDEGISLPERINEEELHRFYAAANSDFSCLLSSIKKTIHWRETYHIMTVRELGMWSKVVFWHGCDMRSQPCLIVRLGLACRSLSADERPKFAQAIVSQVEYGILHLVDEENPKIMVLVDCEGLSPLRLPMQVMRSCSLLLQDHFPNRLACLFVIRLPPVVRVVAQTFIQALNPITRQKLKFIGNKYHEYLTEHLESLPAYLGGNCICTICCSKNVMQNSPAVDIANVTQALTRMSQGEGIIYADPGPETNPNMYPNGEQLVRTAIIGILMFWTFVAFLGGVYDPESRPFSFT